jgi:hypothetical protein
MTPMTSAALAGGVAVLATVAIERLGGRRGGVLASAPTTVVPFSLGLWADPEAFADGMGLVPAGMLVNALFLATWRVLPARLGEAPLGRKLATLVAASLTVWFAAAATAVAVGHAARGASWPTAVVGTVALALGATLGVAACWTPPAAPPGAAKVPPAMLVARAGLAAAAIGGALTLKATFGGLVAGIASVFPAIFLTTMVGLWLSQGAAVPLGAVGPMMLGATSVGLYALSALWTFPALGPAWGAAASWLIAVGGGSFPAALWLSRRPEAKVS